jgi:hypothetical protein
MLGEGGLPPFGFAGVPPAPPARVPDTAAPPAPPVSRLKDGVAKMQTALDSTAASSSGTARGAANFSLPVPNTDIPVRTAGNGLTPQPPAPCTATPLPPHSKRLALCRFVGGEILDETFYKSRSEPAMTRGPKSRGRAVDSGAVCPKRHGLVFNGPRNWLRIAHHVIQPSQTRRRSRSDADASLRPGLLCKTFLCRLPVHG